MRKVLSVLGVLLSLALGLGDLVDAFWGEDPAPLAVAAVPPSHHVFSVLLQRFVDAEGRVNYAGLKAEQSKLRAYTEHLAANPPQDDWPRGEALAYWINAYNAHTLLLVAQQYPIRSIRDLDGGKPWDVPRVRSGQRIYTLNEIENDILRKRYEEPRIHFAINCAAKSCPPLHNHAFQAAAMEQMLEARTSRFVNDAAHNRIAPREAELSRIFEWYAADFGDLRSYINRYSQTKLRSGAKIGFRDYDWALNAR